MKRNSEAPSEYYLSIINKEAIDKFLFEHKGNGCYGLRDPSKDPPINKAWVDSKTNERIYIEYGQVVTE